MDKGPIFIGGLDRCGKTLLRGMLVSHPNISIPTVGSNYWTYFYKRYGDLQVKENFERCFNDMMHYSHVLLLNPDAERVRREFWQGEPTYARLFALFNQHYAERQGKPRWGDQTGLIERFADPVFQAYPGSKMIHVIRDPRDRYEASLDLHPKGRARAGGAAARWVYTTALAKRNLKKYADRYMIVQYESLVTKPEETIEAVCSFLNEEFTPAMLDLEGAPEFIRKTPEELKARGGSSPIYAGFIGRYKNRVPKAEIAFMQSVLGNRMIAYDYRLDEIHFSFGEILRYLFKIWPDNFMRMLAWLTVEFAQQNFPAYFKRKISLDMMR